MDLLEDPEMVQRNKKGGEEEEEQEEEIESRKEKERWKRMKAAKRWNLEGELMFKRRRKEKSDSFDNK